MQTCFYMLYVMRVVCCRDSLIADESTNQTRFILFFDNKIIFFFIYLFKIITIIYSGVSIQTGCYASSEDMYIQMAFLTFYWPRKEEISNNSQPTFKTSLCKTIQYLHHFSLIRNETCWVSGFWKIHTLISIIMFSGNTLLF